MKQNTNTIPSSTDTPVIELRHVDKHFGSLHVLKDINLCVKKGEVVVIIGPSGSGKSTLCRTINRLETIDSGEILIDLRLRKIHSVPYHQPAGDHRFRRDPHRR